MALLTLRYQRKVFYRKCLNYSYRLYPKCVIQNTNRNAKKVICHFRYSSNARRLSLWAERNQSTSFRQSADVFIDGSQASEPNAQQDIRHLRIRCDAEKLAQMDRAEPED